MLVSGHFFDGKEKRLVLVFGISMTNDYVCTRKNTLGHVVKLVDTPS
jgi:hypothetical protein